MAQNDGDHVDIHADTVEVHADRAEVHDEHAGESAGERPPAAGAAPGESAPQGHDERAPEQPVPGREPQSPLTTLKSKEAAIPEPMHDYGESHGHDFNATEQTMHDREYDAAGAPNGEQNSTDDPRGDLGTQGAHADDGQGEREHGLTSGSGSSAGGILHADGHGAGGAFVPHEPAQSPGSPTAVPTAGNAPDDAAGEHELARDNFAAINKTTAPAIMPGEQINTSADVPPPVTPSAGGVVTTEPVVGAGSIVGQERITPRDGEDVTHVEHDARTGTATVRTTGGRTGETVEGPGAASGAVVLGGGPVQVLNAGLARRSTAVAVPRPHTPMHSVESTSPVHPVTADQASAVVNASGAVLRDGDPVPRLSAGHRVSVARPEDPVPRAHLAHTVHAGMSLPRDMIEAQVRAHDYGTASTEELQQAARDVAENARASNVRGDIDTLAARRGVEIAEATRPTERAPLVQTVHAGHGLQIEQPLHAPNRMAPVAPNGIVDHAETEDAYATADDGSRVFVGTRGTPALVPTNGPLNRDWIHAPNLPTDMNANRFEVVDHAAQLKNDDGGF